MKFTVLLYAFCAYILYGVVLRVLKFRKNHEAAKRSGLPLILSPIWPLNHLYLATEKLYTPWLRKLPFLGHQRWLRVCPGDWIWEQRYSVFKEVGDTFLMVTPHRNVVYTCDPWAISQITTRRSDFPKPTEVYRALGIYGDNVVSAEGTEWRRHRKIVAPPFSEKNNHLVWKESLYQAQNMLTQWTGPDGKNSETLDNISPDTMRLSLHIISRAGFNVRCLWPGVDDDDKTALENGAMSTAVIPEGHSMSYVDAMSTLLHRIILIIAVPDWIKKITRFDTLERAHLAHIEWGKYMHELYQRKFKALSNFKEVSAGSDEDPSLDLMGAMISSSGLLSTGGKTIPGTGLSEDEILGNSFVFMLAGHETAANTITHALYFLAMNPSVQRKLQEELDQIFKGKDISSWDYDRDLTPLFGGLTGAVMNETLRLIPPVIIIPKSTFGVGDQKLNLEDRNVVIPSGTYIGLCGAAAHRHHKHWPHGPARPARDGGPVHPTSNRDNDLEEFKPERWLLDPASAEKTAPSPAADAETRRDADAMGVNTSADTAPTLFRPPKGAYVPFSEGFRACVGRRFAQVEILAALAVVVKAHSVELAVDEWAGDEEVDRMGAEQRREVYGRARAKAEGLLNENMGTIITIQLRKGKIPLRVVRRGEERFRDL